MLNREKELLLERLDELPNRFDYRNRNAAFRELVHIVKDLVRRIDELEKKEAIT